MATLADCFSIQQESVVSLIGSGGKTSLMYYLAQSFRSEKVLVTTSTKIGMPKSSVYDYLFTDQKEKKLPIKDGVTVVGNLDPMVQKLSFPTITDRSTFFSNFEHVFIEADGSKQLPLKGWAAHEPVVFPETTATICIVPIQVLGKKISTDTIHRLPLFLELTKSSEGQEIDTEIYVKVVTEPEGILRNAVGRKILFFNQADTEETLAAAKRIVACLSTQQCSAFERIVAGSVQQEKGEVLWESLREN